MSKPPDKNDPDYQRLENRINFALHVGIFAASNSCIWFVRTITYANWDWTILLTESWLALLLIHGIWAFATERNLKQSTPE
ncbi:2TM domain-containing protein [Thalassoporum mexicanum]|uniref:2TM domain-containing protein n=1 Tax=Thalassoporum mexicanum TaxID=3457544 RepID=UPI0021F83FF7|nr:2TM domain-containing protein [Pseudanabaena sp. PCC 7367]